MHRTDSQDFCIRLLYYISESFLLVIPFVVLSNYDTKISESMEQKCWLIYLECWFLACRMILFYSVDCIFVYYFKKKYFFKFFDHFSIFNFWQWCCYQQQKNRIQPPSWSSLLATNPLYNKNTTNRTNQKFDKIYKVLNYC